MPMESLPVTEEVIPMYELWNLDMDLIPDKVRTGNKVVITVFKDNKFQDQPVDHAFELVNKVENLLQGNCETCKSGQKGNMTHTHWPKHWVFDIKFENIWKLENVPPKVFLLPNVESLTIVRCGLESLPHYIGLLRNLKKLDLEGNMLKCLPQTLTFCKELQVLKLANNQLGAVPGFITDFPKLLVLSKQDNSFYSPSEYLENIVATVRSTDKENAPKTGNGKVFQPESLLLASASKVSTSVSNFSMTDPQIKDLPEELRSDVLWYFKEMAICCTCKRGFLPDNQGYRFTKCFEFFRGYSYVPLEGLCCSLTCAESLKSKWDKLASEEKCESKVQDVFCFDVGSTIKYEHSCNLCRGRRTRSLRRWLLCCS